MAAYGNHVEVAGRLVDAGADVNAKDATEQSAYLIATSEVGEDVYLEDNRRARSVVLWETR